MMSFFEMRLENDVAAYGIVTLPKSVFLNLDKYFFINGSDKTTKFMCANKDESRHLISSGVKVIDNVDYYCLILEE